MKIGVLGADFETKSMGLRALAVGSLKCILKHFPTAEVILLGYGRSSYAFPFHAAGQQTVVRFVNIRFSKKVYLRNNIALLILFALAVKLFPSRRLRRRLIAVNPYLKEIEQCDFIASIGGGDSFSDTYGMVRLLYTCLPTVLVLLLGKRLILLPQTLGPFRGRIATALAKFILGGAELIYSRDYQGLRESGRLLGRRTNSDKVRFCFDVGFILDSVRPADLGLVGLVTQSTIGATLVGLNVSGLLYMGGYQRNNMFGFQVNYEQLIYKLIDFLIRTKKTRVLLIPHVFSDAERDSAACEAIYMQLQTKYSGYLGIARGTYDQSEIKYVIGQCDFFIGSRMHACIAAVSQCVPAVSVAYSDKFIGVMEALGVEALVADPRKMEEEEILQIVDQAFERRALVREQLERKIPQVKETVLNLFSEIAGAEGLVRAERATVTVRSLQ